MESLKFLEKINENALKLENKIYRGAIPWYLLCSEEKKIIYVSTSNRNLENYHYMIDSYMNEVRNGKEIIKHKNKKNMENKTISIFENISSNKEDLIGINIELLDILKNKSNFILFLNLQITLDIFFEKVEFINFKVGEEYKFSKILDFLEMNGYTQVYLLEKKGEYSNDKRKRKV